MNFIKNNFKFLLVFLISLFILLYISPLNMGDALWNYEFSYAIARGEIPFKDFNMIVPGFYNFVMAFGLLFYHDNIVFLVEHALLITIAFYFLNKLYGEKAWLFILSMFLILFTAFIPTYNFFLLFLTIIIIYLEEKEKNDYLIGIFLGFLLITKYTVGIFLIVPGIIIYYKSYHKLLKRLVGMVIPLGLYFIYLLWTKSLNYFIDYCVLGLIDFGGHNSKFISIYLICSIFVLIFTAIYVKKYPNDIVGYYVLFFFSIMLPIFNFHHFSIYLAMASLLAIKKISVSSKLVEKIVLMSCVIFLVGYVILIPTDCKFFNINNFKFYYAPKVYKHKYLTLDKMYKKYSKVSKTNMFTMMSAMINTSNEMYVDSYAVFLNGNFGYKETEKIIRKIKSEGNAYYIIDDSEYLRGGQYPVKIVDWLIKNSTFVEKENCFSVYYYK